MKTKKSKKHKMNHIKKLLFFNLFLFGCSNVGEENPFYYRLEGTMIIDQKQGKKIHLHNMNDPEETLGFDLSKLYSDFDIERLNNGDTILKSKLSYDIIRIKNGKGLTIKSKITHP